MDTSTVLEIIKMIDNKIDSIKQSVPDSFYSYPSGIALFHHCKGLEDIKDHLQEYIEAQLSIAENSTGE